jgi:hypothetical protein
MPNPLELLTKPLQLGAQLAFAAIQNIQGLLAGRQHDEPQREPEPAPHQKLQRDEQQARRRAPAKPKQLDDATITDKVETILFRDDSVDKGKIDVNTADGVVWLRGEAKTPEQIKQLEAKALAIPQVKQVENLLHLPKTPAPKQTRRTKSTAAARKRAPRRTTSERKTPATAKAEPTPKQVAAKGEGRQPAPLGSSSSSSSGNGSSGGAS